ncbi:hypothetical protein AN963_15065 [Brevibacillus choshinensis]|uniref:Uncharacterized protein n=1 Tax=Brevibacillus choshinensis TaxID=54911 RepID=A0ABR5N6P2_BRECH|nr:hypothetical protein AN963_15065 [Brevibacillus choshinensis]
MECPQRACQTYIHVDKPQSQEKNLHPFANRWAVAVGRKKEKTLQVSRVTCAGVIPARLCPKYLRFFLLFPDQLSFLEQPFTESIKSMLVAIQFARRGLFQQILISYFIL